MLACNRITEEHWIGKVGSFWKAHTRGKGKECRAGKMVWEMCRGRKHMLYLSEARKYIH